MTFYKYGASALEKPINDVLQRWRISLASLLFFTIFLTDNFGLSTSGLESTSKDSSRRPTYPECIKKDTCNLSITQCLETKIDLTSKICYEGSAYSDSGRASGQKSRISLMRETKLPFCSMFFVYHVINEECNRSVMGGTLQQCRQCIHSVECRDLEARLRYQQFEDLMTRFDCSRNYSSRANCTNCKEQYKNWLCTSSIPYYLIDNQLKKHERLLPCSDFCEQVEAQCPYFLPEVDQQYAGEPSFLCTDRSGSCYSSNQQNFSCYKPCELSIEPRSTPRESCFIHPDYTNSTFHENKRNTNYGSCAVKSNAVSVFSSNQSRCLVAQLTFLVWLIKKSLEYLCIGLT